MRMHVGQQHVAHDAAQRDELGVVAEAEVLSDDAARGPLQRLADLAARRSRHHRARDVDDVIGSFLRSALPIPATASMTYLFVKAPLRRSASGR